MKPSPDCPNAEDIAAFLDGTLSTAAIDDLLAHSGQCASCYSVLSETARFRIDHAPSLSKTRRFPASALLGLAALFILGIGLWTLGPASRWRERQQTEATLARLRALLGTNRPSEARLSVDLPYGPVRPTYRSGTDPNDPLSRDLLLLVLESDNALGDRRSTERLRVSALLNLVAARHDRAIALYEEARDLDPRSATSHSDLGAALLTRGLSSGRKDLSSALAELETASRLSPSEVAPLFNRAIALEALGEAARARSAWLQFLAREPEGPWAAEARRRLLELPGQFQGIPPGGQ